MHYFVQGAFNGQPVLFGGQSYTPVDIEIEGMEANGTGGLPTPTLRIANVNGMPQSMINTYGDLKGCVFRRIRTFSQFLDGQPEADPQAFYGPDIFRVEQKTAENPIFIEWQLSAAVDQQGKMLPGRIAIRDTCLFRYREYVSGSTFDYSRAVCPYSANRYYDKSDQPTTADKDECGRRLSSCKLRFGAGNPLYFGGFPGIGRVRA